MRYRGIIFQGPTIPCMSLPFKLGNEYGMTAPIGFHGVASTDGSFEKGLPPEVVILSEFMMKDGTRPITVEEHHDFVQRGHVANNGIFDVFMYTLGGVKLVFKRPVEHLLVNDPELAGKFFYKAIQKAVREGLFRAKNYVPRWMEIDKATRRQVGKVVRIVPTSNLMVLSKQYQRMQPS